MPVGRCGRFFWAICNLGSGARRGGERNSAGARPVEREWNWISVPRSALWSEGGDSEKGAATRLAGCVTEAARHRVIGATPPQPTGRRTMDELVFLGADASDGLACYDEAVRELFA